MKTYRLITLCAALVSTASLAKILSHERVGDPQAQPAIAAASAP